MKVIKKIKEKVKRVRKPKVVPVEPVAQAYEAPVKEKSVWDTIKGWFE